MPNATHYPKILLIGHGRFGAILYEKLKSLGTIKIVTRDWQDHLEDKDWAVVATPVATHMDIVRECLEHNLNVFCEKPLDEDPDAIVKLITLAQEMGVHLYIDDVFLWRPEYQRIKSLNLPISKISLRMAKYGTFNDSLLATHIYHDLYLISDLTNFAPITDLAIKKIASPLKVGRIDILEFSFRAGDIFVEASYDRTQEKKEKTIIINDTVVWQNDSLTIDNSPASLKKQDALSVMLKAVLSEKADFEYNNKLALSATNLLSSVNRLIPTI